MQEPEVVFIGSSLTRHGLPPSIRETGVLEDGRSCSMLAIPGISEKWSTRLLSHAIEAGAETIFLEINAYAHEYVDWNEPVLVQTLVKSMREIGRRLTLTVKSYFGRTFDAQGDTQCVAPPNGQVLVVARLVSRDYYRFKEIEPAHPRALESQLALARANGIEVIFFSPPRPAALVSMLGSEGFSDLHAHLLEISREFDVPIWYAAEAWSDEYFMDILAHLNSDGRERLKLELAQWYEGRR